MYPFDAAGKRNEVDNQDMSNAVNVLCLGDLCLAGEPESHLIKNPDTDLWEGILPLLHERDIVVASLECSLSERGQPKPLKYACLRAQPAVVSKLNRLDVAVLGNNHISDYGDDAAVDTTDVLKSSGISYLGYGQNLNEALQPLILDRQGVRVGFLAYSCLTTNGDNYAMPMSPGVAPLSLPLIKRSVEKVRPNVDGLFVYLHWGVEQQHYPVPDQMSIARRVIDWGADAVIGTHAHVIQPYEPYRNGHIFYELGNFSFGDVSWTSVGTNGSVTSGVQQQHRANKESLGAYFSVCSGAGGSSVKLLKTWAFVRGDDFVARPVDPSALSVNLDRLNFRTRVYALFHRHYLKGADDISVRTVFGDAKIDHYYASEPINRSLLWRFCNSWNRRLVRIDSFVFRSR